MPVSAFAREREREKTLTIDDVNRMSSYITGAFIGHTTTDGELLPHKWEKLVKIYGKNAQVSSDHAYRVLRQRHHC